MTAPSYPQYQASKAKASVPGTLAPTPADIEGPFYKAGAPMSPEPGKLNLSPSPCQGPALTVKGRVVDTGGNPVTDAVLDFWQADDQGNYDNQGFYLRGKVGVAFDDRGATYHLTTLRPGNYKISDPGQPDEFRCAHIHVKVTAPGFKPLTTQLYFANDPYDATDHWFKKELCITFSDYTKDGMFDFVLEKEQL